MDWRDANNLWQRRAAGVAFISLAKHGDDNFPGFVEMMLETCAVTIYSAERFAQTGTGWVLRELSVADCDSVARFIEQHAALFSAEGMRYATEKMPEYMSAKLRELRREALRSASSQ